MISVKSTLFLLSTSLLVFATDSRVQAATPAAATNVGASQETVICPFGRGETVEVYDSRMRATGVRIAAYEPAKRFQGWGTNSKVLTVGSTHYRTIRVQLPTRPELKKSDVFVFDGTVMTRAACQARIGAPVLPVALLDMGGEDEEGEHEEIGGDDEVDALPPILGSIANTVMNVTKGLNDSKCCLFPIETRPTSYLSGIGRFGAGRRAGRIHGGADLYGRTDQKVRAVENGQVVRAPYFFKQMTMGVDVQHEGGFVARYGEITQKSFGMSLGTQVLRGQQVGTMAKLPCCAPMLHFELYTGGGHGKLSQKGNKYSRRSDIIDPTRYLQKWPLQ
ncbi:MAG: peptidoglycan DD-metalloendopeptidase family protein [Bdellovibrionota bacterium]